MKEKLKNHRIEVNNYECQKSVMPRNDENFI